jgi:hypothetical protein
MLDHPAANKKDYAWQNVNVFTRWWPTDRNIIISFDTPSALRMRYLTPLLDNLDSTSTLDPYLIRLRFAEELVYDVSVLGPQPRAAKRDGTRPQLLSISAS